MRKLTRRDLAWTLGSALAITGGGALSIGVLSDIERFHLGILQSLLGRFEMTSAEFGAFSNDFEVQISDRYGDLSGLKWRFLRAVDESGLADVRSVLSDDQTEKLDKYRRALLTHFVMTTDYELSEGPGTGPVSFLGGENVCANPFAVFDA